MTCVLLDNTDWILGTYKHNVSIKPWDTTHYYYVRFFTFAHIANFFSIEPFRLLLHPIRSVGFPFLSIYGQPYQTLLWHIAFWFFPCFTFSGWHVFIYFTTIAWDGVMQFLVMLYSVGGLIWKRYFWRVIPLLNIVLISYRLYIFWIFSARLLT